jgi:hypothetical protein
VSPKHSVFWLLLQDKLNTRDRLRRRHMHLDSYTCENCILQKNETSYNLFLRCSFAKSCRASIGLIPPQTICPQRAAMRLKRQLNMSGALELVILMSWSIWQCRNGWIFNNIPPTIERCRGIFLQEVKWLLLRLKPSTSQIICSWLERVFN